MTWSLLIANRAKRQLGRLPAAERHRIDEAFSEMCEDPFVGDVKFLRGQALFVEGSAIGAFSSSLRKLNANYKSSHHRPRSRAPWLKYLLTEGELIRDTNTLPLPRGPQGVQRASGKKGCVIDKQKHVRSAPVRHFLLGFDHLSHPIRCGRDRQHAEVRDTEFPHVLPARLASW